MTETETVTLEEALRTARSQIDSATARVAELERIQALQEVIPHIRRVEVYVGTNSRTLEPSLLRGSPGLPRAAVVEALKRHVAQLAERLGVDLEDGARDREQ